MTDRKRDFLIFALRDSFYALDLAQIAEVGDPPQISAIPLSPACYSGAFNFHGDIVAVLNLALFLDLPGCSRPGKIVVLSQEVASLALLVDAVIRIVSEDEVTFRPPPDNRFAAATLGLHDSEAIQLDLGALVHHAEIVMQKKR